MGRRGRRHARKGQCSDNAASWEGGSAPEGGQAVEEKVEEKVRRLSGEGGRGYIDCAAGIRRRAAGAKAARQGRDAESGHARP